MRLIAILFIFLYSAHLFPQQGDEDVKVGLVLSGGGAKGLAHIGALKVIEESGVRIDYIGGTSMGAIVGALYASGYSAKQLDSLFTAVDFERLIQDNIPRKAKTFYEKEDAEKYAITLPFDQFKISLPTSISQGQNVYNLLYQLTDHVSHIEDFSQLPIPFFCMATNVETGEAVKLNKGYLPQAISASGALPSLFSPVEIDGKLLIDGGVTNNYPIDEVKKKGMDVIIGVDVQDSLISRENLRSAIDVLVQINNYRTIHDMTSKRKKTDIYIHPNIKDFSVISFNRGKEIIKSGENQALLYKKDLELLASRQQAKERPHFNKSIPDSLRIEAVTVSGNKEYTRSYIMGKLKLKPPTTVSYKRFNEGINNISATGNFRQINYSFQEIDTNKIILHVTLKENRTQNLLRLGVHYDDVYKSAALINVTRKRLFQKNDIASLDLIIGDNLRYNFDYYIDKGYYWSFGVKSRYNRFKKNVSYSAFSPELYMENPSVANIELEHQDFTNQIYVQTLFQQIYSLGIGVEQKNIRMLSETLGVADVSQGKIIFEDSNYYSAFGVLKLDNRDNKYFPRSGFYFEGNFNFYLLASGTDTDFDQFSIAKSKFKYAFTPLNKFTVLLSSEGGFKIGGRNTNSLDFFLGGYGFQPINNFVHFFGYDALSLRGDTYLKSSVRLNYEIFRKNYIIGAANIANVGDQLFRNTGWIDRINYRGYALGYGLETYIGPIELLYSYSPESRNSEWYVSVGFWF